MTSPAAEVVPLRTIAINWTRIGITGFGGPRTHIALLRRLVVERERWVDQRWARGSTGGGAFAAPATTDAPAELGARSRSLMNRSLV